MNNIREKMTQDNEYGKRCVLEFRLGKDEIVSVSKYRGLRSSAPWAPAEINWHTISSVSVWDTEAFIQCLKRAVEIAREWDENDE